MLAVLQVLVLLLLPPLTLIKWVQGLLSVLKVVMPLLLLLFLHSFEFKMVVCALMKTAEGCRLFWNLLLFLFLLFFYVIDARTHRQAVVRLSMS